MRPAGELPARDRCFRFQVGLQRTQADVDLGRLYFHEQLLAQIQVVIFAARRRDSSMQARRFDKTPREDVQAAMPQNSAIDCRDFFVHSRTAEDLHPS
jgi:hypothetical protein